MKTIIIIILAIIFVLIIFNRIAKKYYFICPSCGNRFKAPARQLITTLHVWDEHYLKCPDCGKRKYMEQMKEK